MAYAYDFNRVPGPSPDEIKAADGDGSLIYGTGAQQSDAWVKGHHAADLKVVRIWEHNTDSILTMDGAAECRTFEANNPPGLVYLACDLNDAALAGRDVTRFCREWCSVTREDEVGLYGSSTAIAQGQGAGIPKLTKWWGVVNWIVGGGPDNAPQNIDYWTNAGAHLIQLIGSPIPDTDQNLILKDDWWSTGRVVPPTPEDDDDTMVYKTSDDGKDQWYRDAGGVLVKIDPLLAIALGAFTPGKVVDLGGALGALAFSKASVDARAALK